jgi:two-component system C4-dicarboxylate transport sensor histidine kinase DctB
MQSETALSAAQDMPMPWRQRLLFTAIAMVALGVVLATNRWLSVSFTETTRTRAELRLAFYSGNLVTELQRTSVVPLLLTNDPRFTVALAEGAHAATAQRLTDIQAEIGVGSILLLDRDGVAVAATEPLLLNGKYGDQPVFARATAVEETVFSVTPQDAGGYAFGFSRAVRSNGVLIGVIVVGVDLTKNQRSWTSLLDEVLVTDADGRILLATDPRWTGLTMEQALAAPAPPNAIDRAWAATTDWAQSPPDAYVAGEAVLATSASVPFAGWRIHAFTTYASVRERVNGVLALEIMAFAILAALSFYMLSRRAWSQSLSFQRESAELRLLNARLSREIAEREKVQKTLEVAELSLAQSSKLAALGEMSAAVSHELNQPLAAMKTYLAGARLLLQRKRPDDALSSFHRIDDLIDRMGAITRQLKSYARKGGDALEPLDMRNAVSGALAMMEPQLKVRVVRINRSVPRAPVMVMADRLRLEQVIINLLRNALDALREVEAPQIDLTLTMGETALLTVADNGPGLADPEQVFEPFYTTKKPGEGTGLGLAISLGIIADFGGRMTATNSEEGGAVLRISLPLLETATNALPARPPALSSAAE